MRSLDGRKLGYGGVAALVATAWALTAQADATWTNTAGGNFHTPANWDNGVPGPGDRATFNLNQDYTVSWTADAANKEAYFAQPNGRKVTLNLGAQTWRLGNVLNVGASAGQNALVEQNGGTVVVTNTLGLSSLHPGGIGMYTLRSGQLRFNGGMIGYVASGSQLVVDGPGSVCTSSAAMTVGYFGTVQMIVTNAGAFTMTSGILDLGYTGKNCELTVAAGGRIEAPQLRVGGVAAGAGNQVRVTGDQSWLKAPSIVIGSVGGRNRMTVGQGGTVECTDFYLGYFSGTNTLQIEAGGTLRASTLRASFTTGGISNTIRVTGGQLIVTNAAGTGVVELGPNQGLKSRLALEDGNMIVDELRLYKGTLQMTGGTGTFSRLKAELNPHSELNLRGGVLNTKSTQVSNGAAVTIGDGSLNAVLNLQGGGHKFSDGLIITNAAALTGTGGVGGNVAVCDGGAISPGGSAGTLVLSNNLALSSQSLLNFELGPFDAATGLGYVGGGTNDLIEVKGNLTLDGVLNLAALPGLDELGATSTQTYRLINYTGSLTDNGLTIGTAPPRAGAYEIDTSVDKQVNLKVRPPSGTVIAVR